MYLQHMSEKVGSRLRKHRLQSDCFYIGIKCKKGWIGDRMKCPYPTDDGKSIMKLGRQMILERWTRDGINQIQVTAVRPKALAQQIDFLEDINQNIHVREKNRVMDLINNRYGDLTIVPSNLIKRSSMPDVIAPAWKPTGHRRTV